MTKPKVPFPRNYPKLEYLIQRNKYLEFDPLPEDVLSRFYHTLEAHIACVQEAGIKLGLKEEQLDTHDLSKFSQSEFGAYAKHFQGGGAPQEFAEAWLHHLHFNEHHWQHFMFPDEFSPAGTNIRRGVMPMPEKFALEMVADWMGAGKAYTDSDDMTDWLLKNVPRITLHQKTAEFVTKTLDDLGYTDVMKAKKFDVRFIQEIIHVERY